MSLRLWSHVTLTQAHLEREVEERLVQIPRRRRNQALVRSEVKAALDDSEGRRSELQSKL